MSRHSPFNVIQVDAHPLMWYKQTLYKNLKFLENVLSRHFSFMTFFLYSSFLSYFLPSIPTKPKTYLENIFVLITIKWNWESKFFRNNFSTLQKKSLILNLILTSNRNFSYFSLRIIWKAESGKEMKRKPRKLVTFVLKGKV